VAPGVGNSAAVNASGTNIKNITAHVFLLPYLDQAAIYNKLNFSEPFSSASVSGSGPVIAAVGNVNTNATNVELAAFRCPSDMNYNDPSTVAGVTHYGRINARRTSYAFCDYTYDHAAIVNYNDNTSAAKGVTGLNGAASITEIKDGTSNTMMLCETPFKKTSTSYGPFWNCWVYTSGIAPGSYGINVPYINSSGYNYGVPYAFRAGSAHEGGMHVLMADGSTHFMSASTDSNLIKALISVRGKETTTWP